MEDFNSANLDDSISGTSHSSSNEDELPTTYTTMFNLNQPLVLELHEVKKDDPVTPADATVAMTNAQPTVAVSETKTKKKKKRKRLFSHESKEPPTKAASVSSSDVDADTANNEEFYDARESYHGIGPPPVQVVGSQVAAAPVLTTSLGSTIASVPSDVLDSLKMVGNHDQPPELSPDEAAAQGAIHKPTAPPS